MQPVACSVNVFVLFNAWCATLYMVAHVNCGTLATMHACVNELCWWRGRRQHAQHHAAEAASSPAAQLLAC